MCMCSICNKKEREFIFNNKLICMRCDELTFDIEIESDEIEELPKIRKTKEEETNTRYLPTLN